VREFAIGAGVVDGHRQLVGQHLGELVDRDVIFRRQLPDRVIAQNLPQLIRRDRQVLTIPDFTCPPRPACSSFATIALRPPWLPVPMTSLRTAGSTAAPSWLSALLNAGEFSSESKIPMTILSSHARPAARIRPL
jgi:hypothetical protein